MEAQTHRMADYPYPLHTNRELEMMLAGAKPFAVFAHERVEGFDKCDALAGQDFETHVARGTMSEHVRTVRHATGEAEIDYYFYALPGEEWRVEAYLMLLELLHRGPGAASWNGWRAGCSVIPTSRTSTILPAPIRTDGGAEACAPSDAEHQQSIRRDWRRVSPPKVRYRRAQLAPRTRNLTHPPDRTPCAM